MSMTVIGITLVSIYDTEKDVRLEVGQSYELAGYKFAFKKIESVKVDNYIANRATMDVTLNGELVNNMHPEKRDYGRDQMPMTEAGIDAGFTRDLFVALGEPLGNNAWSFRLYHKPFVRWIWLGAVLMGFGGMLAGGCAIGAGVTGGSIFAGTAWAALTAFWIGGMATDFLVFRRGALARA